MIKACSVGPPGALVLACRPVSPVSGCCWDPKDAPVPCLACRLFESARAECTERVERGNEDGRRGRDGPVADEPAKYGPGHDLYGFVLVTVCKLESIDPFKSEGLGCGLYFMDEAVDAASRNAARKMSGDHEESVVENLGVTGDRTPMRGPTVEKRREAFEEDGASRF